MPFRNVGYSDAIINECISVLETTLESLQQEFRKQTGGLPTRSPISEASVLSTELNETIPPGYSTEYDFIVYRAMSSNTMFCFMYPNLAFRLMDPEGTGKVSKSNFCKYAPEMPPLCDRMTAIRVFEHLASDGSYLEELVFKSYVDALKDYPNSSWKAIRLRAHISDKMLLLITPAREGNDRIPKQGNLFLTENHLYFHSTMGSSRTIRIGSIVGIKTKKFGTLDLDRGVEITVDESQATGSPLNTTSLHSISPTGYDQSAFDSASTPNTSNNRYANRTYTFSFSPQDMVRDLVVLFLNEIILARKLSPQIPSIRSISNIGPGLLFACNNLNRARALYKVTRRLCQGLLVFTNSKNEALLMLKSNGEVPLPIFFVDSDPIPLPKLQVSPDQLANQLDKAFDEGPSLTPVPSFGKLDSAINPLNPSNITVTTPTKSTPKVVVKTFANTIGDHLEYIRDLQKDRRRSSAGDMDDFEFRKMKERLTELLALIAPILRIVDAVQDVLNWTDPPVTCLIFLLFLCVFLYDLTEYLPTLVLFAHAAYLIYNYVKIHVAKQPVISEQSEYAAAQSSHSTRFRRPVKALLAKINIVEAKLAQLQDSIGKLNTYIRTTYGLYFWEVKSLTTGYVILSTLAGLVLAIIPLRYVYLAAVVWAFTQRFTTPIACPARFQELLKNLDKEKD